MRVAVIDIGTNSTRLLVADVTKSGIDEQFRRSIVTRLGDRVDETGRLDDDACQRVYDVIERYEGEAVKAGAERIFGVATSAVREAANGDEFQAEIEDRFGVELSVISGDREAQLTFAGASYAGKANGAGRSLVIDIGGGSTELIVGDDGHLAFHVSTFVGAVRQSERHLKSDPPTPEELEALIEEVAAIIRDQVPAEFRSDVTRGIGVAGTPTVLASVDQELEVFDPWKVHGYAITREACERLLMRLASLPLEQRRDVTGLHPDRAPTIVAGAAIMLAAMREFSLDSIEVSEHDILYGLALEAAAE
jgi:exopolyphosphatase/guanosine-5'-triphosphate,3'-diphosphate pyrophosphatase